MSREIKFRAWLKPRWDDDGDANQMYYNIQNSYDNLGDVKPFDPMTSFSSWFVDNIAIVEQYTGLKDKNGKEIYEGDIVKDHNEWIAVIVWREKMAAFGIKWVDGVEDDFEFHLSCEVIGNIHEPPKDFRPEHLKRMGVSISKGGEE